MKKKAEEKRGLKSVNSVVTSNREKDPSPLTCDMLLLSGSVIANEAMLTGESIPQIKEIIENEKRLSVSKWYIFTKNFGQWLKYLVKNKKR